MFPEIRYWHTWVERCLYTGQPIRSPFGRSWSLVPKDRNAALNAPIQSSTSDLFLLGLSQVWDQLPGQVVNLVHDEIDVFIPHGTFDRSQWRKIAKIIASADPRFPMAAEVSVGPDWGSTEKQFIEAATPGSPPDPAATAIPLDREDTLLG